MAIGYTEAYYPGTGVAEGSTFEYTPVSKEVQAQQVAAMQANNRTGPSNDIGFNMEEALKQLGLERAEEAMVMAMRYQGQRMYNQALKNGEDAGTALAKAAPLMFYSKSGGNAGEMINALRPRTVAPITPYQQEMINLARQREQRMSLPKEIAPGTVGEVNVGGKKFAQVRNPNGAITLHPINPERPPALSPEDQAVKAAYQTALSEAVKERIGMTPERPNALTGWGGNLDQIRTAIDKEATLRRTLSKLGTKKAVAPSVPNADEEEEPTVIPPTTKRFTFQNGQLIPIK